MGLNFERVFDRLIGVPAGDATLSSDLLNTTMLRPLGFVMASLGFLMMSGAAFWITRAGWASAWFALDIVLLLARLLPALQSWRAGTRMPDSTARVILFAASLMFATFGVGCAASFLTGPEELRISAVVGSMGLLAGVATRWAAFPRLAVGTSAVVALPMIVATAALSALASTLYAILAVGTAVLIIQNNRTLRSMLSAERLAKSMSRQDPLTGLLNRAGLEDCLSSLDLNQASLLYLDLDGFKAVNDTYGHAAGDHVLREVAARLRSLGKSDFVARLGGDEFVVVISSADLVRANMLAGEISRTLETPILLPERLGQASVGVSCGVAIGSSETIVATLLADADAALYAVKRAKNRRVLATLAYAPTSRSVARCCV
jgi:diguanylate cyclase (GGDEF)-like protein